jgi:serine/threonine protein phosphatase PrpC
MERLMQPAPLMSTREPTGQQVGVNVFGRSDVGRVREKNEDTFVIADLMVSAPIHAMPRPIALEVRQRGILLAVSDGMGGAQAGEVASALTLHALRSGLSSVEANSAEEALVACVEAANAKVWQVANDSGRNGMGATITAVLLHGQRAYVAEVGDSRAYVLRGKRLVQLTHDQSCVQLLLDNGTLTREQAETFQYRNIILQAIGTKSSVVVALNRFTLRRGDRLLLCSDGLSGKVGDREMQAIVATTESLEAACASLIELANARGGEDNITVVLAEAAGDGLPALTGNERVSLETVQAFDGEARSDGSARG